MSIYINNAGDLIHTPASKGGIQPTSFINYAKTKFRNSTETGGHTMSLNLQLEKELEKKESRTHKIS